jgi:hypothetical protein
VSRSVASLFRLPADERRRLAQQYVGQMVRVGVDPFRDGATVYERIGRAVAVAVPEAGSVSDLLIVEVGDRHYPRAIPLARIRTIEPVR